LLALSGEDGATNSVLGWRRRRRSLARVRATPRCPDGVTVAGGVVYAATNHAAVALNAATGVQLWSRTLIGNDHEGIDMAPGYNHGTVYVSTVPVNPLVGEYLGGGKAGILIELDAQTGKLLWKLPVGAHSGHENDGLLTEHATPTSHDPLPAGYCLQPSIYGGIETQLASNGSTTFAAVNDLALPATPAGYTGSVTRSCSPPPSTATTLSLAPAPRCPVRSGT
jgi:hypothetical protein